MRLIRPTIITPAMLTASNVPETDYTAWSAATAYVVGNQCLYNHKNYECLVNNTNYQPDLNTGGTTPKWLDLGYDNRWKMFDAVVGSQTSQADSITLTVAPGLIDSIAFLDLEATEIIVTMTDPVEGVVYTDTINLITKSAIIDGYTYFFEPIITDDACVLLGIPPYSAASIAITINNPGGTAKIGTLIFGTQKYLGGTQYNPSIGIVDYSRKEKDVFGNFSVTERSYSKRLGCDFYIKNTTVDDIQRTLAGYRATPVVWVGVDSRFSSMIIYGFFKSFDIVVKYPTMSICSIDIEGL